MQLIITKSNAFSADKIPAGISRIAVRGFLASKCLSRYLLNAIAALLAEIIQIITNNSFQSIKGSLIIRIDPSGVRSINLLGTIAFGKAIKKPIIAKGNAKIVCENLTRLK